MLASDFWRIATEHGYDVASVSRHDMDIADSSSVWRTIEGVRPDYVIDAAGIDVDTCELNPSEE